MTDVGHIRFQKAPAFVDDPERGTGPFRVFIGMDADDPEWTHVDRRFEAWEAARDYLAARLSLWRGDGCHVCARTGAEELDRLMNVPAGAPFAGEVEGEDFVIEIDQDDTGRTTPTP